MSEVAYRSEYPPFFVTCDLVVLSVRDVGTLLAGATRERRPLSTFALDAEIRFASAADRAAFADELGAAVTSLIGRYHEDAAPRGRMHRVLVAIHPSMPTNAPSTAPKEA